VNLFMCRQLQAQQADSDALQKLLQMRQDQEQHSRKLQQQSNSRSQDGPGGQKQLYVALRHAMKLLSWCVPHHLQISHCWHCPGYPGMIELLICVVGALRAGGPRHDNDKANHLEMSVAPTRDEVLCNIVPYVPQNRYLLLHALLLHHGHLPCPIR
jgi:hypothetical protein